MSSGTSKVDRPRIPPRPTPAEAGADARERIIRTAYELFTRHGLAAVGVDRVLERHRQLWLRDWLEPKLAGGDTSAADRLLAVFDSFEEWFGDDSFNGCLFINSLLVLDDYDGSILSDEDRRVLKAAPCCMQKAGLRGSARPSTRPRIASSGARRPASFPTVSPSTW